MHKNMKRRRDAHSSKGKDHRSWAKKMSAKLDAIEATWIDSIKRRAMTTEEPEIPPNGGRSTCPTCAATWFGNPCPVCNFHSHELKEEEK